MKNKKINLEFDGIIKSLVKTSSPLKISALESADSYVNFPDYTGVRVIMMPFDFKQPDLIPEYLKHYSEFIAECLSYLDIEAITKETSVGYITIDETFVKAGSTQRREGLHIDAGCWGGGGGSVWGKSGFVIASTVKNSTLAYNNVFVKPEMFLKGGAIAPEVEMFFKMFYEDHKTILDANTFHFMSPYCVHEALPVTKNTERQFFRLSLPNTDPWPSNYTKNPFVDAPGQYMQPSDYVNT